MPLRQNSAALVRIRPLTKPKFVLARVPSPPRLGNQLSIFPATLRSLTRSSRQHILLHAGAYCGEGLVGLAWHRDNDSAMTDRWK
jgi:hypothetical protein